MAGPTGEFAAWLALCRVAVAGIDHELLSRPTKAVRAEVVGMGEGGDETVAIDKAAEEVVVAALEDHAGSGASFTLVSEELGVRTFGQPSPWHVVVDPIDGSLNAKRGLPAFALSVAVADGPTLGDVRWAFVHDFGTKEEWVAERGAGATLAGRALGEEQPEEALRLVVFEATTSELLAGATARLTEEVERVRIIGSLALALCHLAAGRVDGVATLKPTRAVDVAAGQLLIREAGFAYRHDGGDALAAPLDVTTRARVVAARDDAACDRLAALLPPLGVT